MRHAALLQGFLGLLLAAVLLLILHTAHLASFPSQPAVSEVEADSVEALSPDSVLPPPVVTPMPSEDHGPTPGLQRFIEALAELRKQGGKARIAYFGDSMIEGDLITQTLRQQLQQEFGGEGVGFVPITSAIYGFRKSVKHRFSEGWKDYHLLQSSPPPLPLGISGECFLTTAPYTPRTAWVSYAGTDLFPGTTRLPGLRLFYGLPAQVPPQPPQIHLEEAEGPGISLPLERTVNALTLIDTATEEVRLHFELPANLPVYGVSLDGHEGIYLDNFPSRGNSGMNLIDIPASTLQGFQDHMEYDLVVLQFGLNVIAPQRKSFRSYQRGMRLVIEHFKAHMPEADILLVGVGDKSSLVDGQLQTDPSVPLVVAAQRELAEEMGVGFVDLYTGMGGHNAMIRWVKDRLARSDHAHPTRRGATVIAGIIYDHLIDLYQEQTGEVLPQAGEMAARLNY